MTEEQYQQVRKIMQTANGLRGMITKQKGEVVKWTDLEDYHKKEGRETEGVRRAINKCIDKLNDYREKFSNLRLPDHNIEAPKAESVQCEGCGARIAKGNTYCGECLVED